MADTPQEKPIVPEQKKPDSQKKRQNPAPILRAELQIPHSVTDTYTTDQRKKDRIEWWKLVIEIATLVAIIVYTGIVYRQWDTMRDATLATKKSADAAISASDTAKQTLDQITKNVMLDQRAWIGTNGVKGIWELSNPVTISIGIKNTGKTPAKNLTNSMRCQIVGKNNPPVFAEEPPDLGTHSKSIIAPQQEMFAEDPFCEGCETEHRDGLINDVINGEQRFFVHGTIDYEDIFRKPHWLTFCFFYDPMIRKPKLINHTASTMTLTTINRFTFAFPLPKTRYYSWVRNV